MKIFFAPIARLKFIRILIVFACFKDFILYLMDVKIFFFQMVTFRRKFIQNNILILKKSKVFKLKKILYILKQTPRGWYDWLRKFLLENSFKMGNIMKTLLLEETNLIFDHLV